MAKRYELVDQRMLQPLFGLVFLSGVALVLSIPWARYVRDFSTFAFFSEFPIYFSAHAFLVGILGLNLGAISAARREPIVLSVSLLTKRVLLGQFLTLPYLLFARAIYPGKDGTFALILLLTTLVSLACALASRLVEEPSGPSSSRGFPLKYLLFLTWYLAPLATFPTLSPLGAVAGLLRGERGDRLFFAYAIPCAVLLFALLLVRGRAEGERRV